MAKWRKRRHWSGDERRMVCAQSQFSDVSVSQVARGYDVNANQVFNYARIAGFSAGSVALFNAPAISCSPEIACGVLRSSDRAAIIGANSAVC